MSDSGVCGLPAGYAGPYTIVMNIPLESIDTRTSVRSFSGQGLDSSDRRLLETAMASSGPCPFGTKPRFALVEPESVGDVASGRIGTYGIIKNAPAFIVGAAGNAPFACADFGYALEGVVLVAAANGLCTCWLGGTFDRSGAKEVLRLTEDEVVPAVTPVGEPADRRSMVETAMRAFAGSKKGTTRSPRQRVDSGSRHLKRSDVVPPLQTSSHGGSCARALTRIRSSTCSWMRTRPTTTRYAASGSRNST